MVVRFLIHGGWVCKRRTMQQEKGNQRKCKAGIITVKEKKNSRQRNKRNEKIAMRAQKPRRGTRLPRVSSGVLFKSKTGTSGRERHMEMP
jgi:hypothetical protein